MVWSNHKRADFANAVHTCSLSYIMDRRNLSNAVPSYTDQDVQILDGSNNARTPVEHLNLQLHDPSKPSADDAGSQSIHVALLETSIHKATIFSHLSSSTHTDLIYR